MIRPLTLSLLLALLATAFAAWSQQPPLAPPAPIIAPASGPLSEPSPAPEPSPTPAPAPAPTPRPKLTPIQGPMLYFPPFNPADQCLPPPDHPLTVKEAVRLALAHQPSLAIAQGGVEVAQGLTVQAQAAAKPSASLSVFFFPNGQNGQNNASTQNPPAQGTSGVTTGRGRNLTIAAQQTVYDWGRTPAAIATARFSQASAQNALCQAQQDVINLTKQDYYTLLQNQHLADVQRQNLVGQQAHLDLANARFRAGVAPAPTSTWPKPPSRKPSTPSCKPSPSPLNPSSTSTTKWASTPAPRPKWWRWKSPAPSFLPSWNWSNRPFASAPRSPSWRPAVCANLEAVKVAYTIDKPRIFYEVTATATGSSFFSTPSDITYGFGLSWLFYDGGLTRGSVQSARGNLLIAEAQLCQGKTNISQDVVRAYLNVQSATVQVTTASAAVKSGTESVRLASGRYAAGVATFVEVLDAQTLLLQAEVSEVNAHFNLSLARDSLAHALGEEEC